MKETTRKILNGTVEKYSSLQPYSDDIEKAFELLKNCFLKGGKLLVCGNGGSASDCEHIVGELLKKFKKHREINAEVRRNLRALGEKGEFLSERLEGSLPAVSLISQTGIITAFANDNSWDAVFAQEVYGLGNEGDCLMCLSTSGNSKNCVYAALTAKAKKLSVISLTGMGGGELASVSDCLIAVPEKETYKIQELHLPVYHCVCAMLEEELF